MGAGAVGGYYGARLMQAGHTVHFIARGGTLSALAKRGLRVHRDTETINLPEVSATDRPADIGPVDLLLFTTKGQHLPEAVPACKPMVAQHTVVLPLLNGMDISERIGAGLGSGTVLGALTYIPAKTTEPGVVHQAGEEQRLILGALEPAHEQLARSTLNLLQKAGINAELSPSVQTELWIKFMAYLAFAGAQCTSRLQVAEMLEDPDTSALFDDIIREGGALSGASGASVPPGQVEKLRAIVASNPPGHNVSMFNDLQAGRPLEFDTTLGAVVALGERLGVPIPALRRAYEAIKPFAAGVT